MEPGWRWELSAVHLLRLRRHTQDDDTLSPALRLDTFKMAMHSPDSGSGGSGPGQDTLSTLEAAMADGPVAELLLRRLEASDGGLDSAELAAELGMEHQAVVGAVKSLQALGEVSRARDAGPPCPCTYGPLARRALRPEQIPSGLVWGTCICVHPGMRGREVGRVRAQMFLMQ